MGDELSGNSLFKTVTAATGLPQESITSELTRLLDRAGVSREELTLDELRKILTDYVQDVLLEAKEDVEVA